MSVISKEQQQRLDQERLDDLFNNEIEGRWCDPKETERLFNDDEFNNRLDRAFASSPPKKQGIIKKFFARLIHKAH